jgi:hypothetical protein
MNKEDVYKYYGWNPSDGDYKPPIQQEVVRHSIFLLYAGNMYKLFLKIIFLKFF